MARPSKQSNKYDFTVEAVPLQLPDGTASGWLGNVRTDTKKVLGVTTEKYGILQNTDLLNAAREALQVRGFKDAQEKIIVTGDGATLHAEFTFKEKQLAVPGVGDMLGYKLRLVNSFDRTLRASWAMGFLRLACLNGMVTLDSEFAMTAKHSTQISLNFLGEALDKAIAGFDTAANIFGELATRQITDEQGVVILHNLTKRKVLSEVIREDVELLWRQPKRKEDEARNVFNLYNAVTEHLTHKVAGERYEYALRTETKVLHELKRAINSTSIFDALLRPVEKTKVVEVEASVAPAETPAPAAS